MNGNQCAFYCWLGPFKAMFKQLRIHMDMTGKRAWSICVNELYILVPSRAADRFLQVFISPNSREKQLPLWLCIPTSTCKRNAERKQVLLAPTVPVSLSLLFFFFCPTDLTLSLAQMLPSSTSSTARPPRTLRSCVRLAPRSSQCARTSPSPLPPRLPRPADPSPLSLQSSTHTPWPTPAPSPASRACLSPSPPRASAGLRLLVCPSLWHSRPHCGGSCPGSGTALSWRSSQRTRGGYRR